MAVICLAPPRVDAAPITAGNIVVFRAGSGTNALSSTAGNDVILDERTTAGVLVQSIAINATGTGTKLITAGSATAEGALSISPDGRWITFAGYNATIPQASSLPSSSSTSVPRSVGILDTTTGNVTLTTTGTWYNAGAVRTAYSSDGDRFWTAGSNTGILYGTVSGGTASLVNSTAAGTSLRQLGQYGNNLYLSSASGTLPTVGLLGGNPLSGTTPTSNDVIPNIPRQGGSPTLSRYGFTFLDTNPAVPGIDTMYTVDDSTTAGGLWKYTLGLSGTWNAAGSITALTGQLRGLAGTVSGSNVQLFMTGSANTLWTYTDALAATSSLSGTLSAFSSLATASGSTAFRGVVFVPGAVTPRALIWNTTDGTWNTSATNWTTGTGGTFAFSSGDSVTFSGTGGSVTLSGSLAPSSATVSATAGTYTLTSSAGNQITGTAALSKSGAGTLVLAGPNAYSGGTTLSAGTLRVGDNAAVGTGTLALDGGTLTSDGATARTVTNAVTVGGNVALGDATATGALTLSGNVDLGGATRTLTTVADTTLSGVVSGSGGLTKDGAGVLTLSANSSFTGSTDITAGTLKLSGAGGIGSSDIIAVEGGATLDVSAVTGGWQLASGQTLTGDGTVVGPATAAVGSTVYPGGVTGTLTATGGFTLLGLLDLDIDGSTISQLDASAGALTLGGSLRFTTLSGPTGNLVFATYQSLTGTFGSITGLPSGYSVDYAYLGNQIALVQSTPPTPGVPEIDPAGLAGVAALVTGTLGLLERRRGPRNGG